MQLLAETFSPHSAVTIQRPSGLDARSAVMMANTANRYRCPITVRCGDRAVDGRSIMDLILLDAQHQQKLLIEAEGEDGPRAIEALQRLVENNFGLS